MRAEELVARTFHDASLRMAAITHHRRDNTRNTFGALSGLEADDMSRDIEARLHTEFAGDRIAEQLVESAILDTVSGMAGVARWLSGAGAPAQGRSADTDASKADYLNENAYRFALVSPRLAAVIRLIAATAGFGDESFRSTEVLLWSHAAKVMRDEQLRIHAFGVASVMQSSGPASALLKAKVSDLEEVEEILGKGKKSRDH